MSTALNVYGSTVASTTLTSAGTLATALGGGSGQKTTKIGTSTGWGELHALGYTSPWPASGSIGSPSGNGWLFDATTLEGQQLLAGTWTPVITLSISNGTSITATVTMRAYVRSSGGTYTAIGSSTSSSSTITPSAAAITLPTFSGAATAFGAGDKLYIDAWLNITATSGTGTTTTMVVSQSNTSLGLANEVEMDTPGYQAVARRDIATRLRLAATQVLDVATRFRLLATTNKDVALRFRLSSVVLAHDIATRLRLLATSNKDIALRIRIFTPFHDIAVRLGMVPSIGGSTTTAFGPLTTQHTWLLPDNSMIAVYQAGTDTRYASNGVIVIQSPNWQSANPTWTFVKQLNTSTSFRVSSYWDGTRLHTVTAPTTTSGNTLTYFSGTYSNGAWNWDASTTQIGTTTTASLPVITTDASNNNVFVVYRQNTSGTYSLQAAVRVTGTWQTPYQVSVTTPTSANMYATLTRSGTNIALVTYENNGNINASIHPDGTDPQTGWGTIVASSSSSSGIPGVLYGTVSSYADSSSSAWVSWGASGSGPGLFLQRFTFSGTTVTWQGSAQLITNTTNTSCVLFSRALGTLYGVFYQGTAASANILYTTLPSGASSWTTPSNITYAAGAANVSPTVPASIVNYVLPVFFQTTTAGDAPIAQINMTFAKDIAARFRLLSIQTRDIAMRLRLATGQQKDIALRFRVLAVTQKDIAARLRLSSAIGFRDLAARVRLLATTQRDIAARLRLSSAPLPHDLATRFRLLTSIQRDMALRFKLLAITNKDMATRFKLLATMNKDIATRMRLLASSNRDIAGRYRLLASTQRDIAVRYRLQNALAMNRDIAARLKLLATSNRDIATRLRVLAVTSKDIATRFRLSSSTQYRDIATRYRLLVATNKDIAARLRLNSAVTPHDLASRFRLLATMSRDVALRYRLQPAIVMNRDVAVRFRVLATTSKDIATRFCLLMTSSKDVAMRFRLLASTSRDISLRARLLVTTRKDIATRVRVLTTIQRDIATRTRVLATTSKDVATRTRLCASISRDVALRTRLMSLVLTHDLALRMRLQGSTKKDIAIRLKVLAQVSRDVVLRMRLASVMQTHDIALRTRLSQPTSRDVALRFRLEGPSIITVQVYGRDYTVQVGGR